MFRTGPIRFMCTKILKMDYRSFLNNTELARKPSPLRELFDGLGVDMTYVLLAGGLPNPDVFPITGIDLTLRKDITLDNTKVSFSREDMNMALQYGVTTGNPELVGYISDIIKRLHNPPTMNDPSHPAAVKIGMTAGSQDGIYKMVNILVGEGDVVMTEEHVYPNLMAVVEPLKGKIASIKTDKYGIIPESLAAYLSQWPKPENGCPSKGKLKLLYCVPNGDNPTGIRYTKERKQAIYKLAQEYNFIILEDDAYFFLEKRPLTDSFLSMDVDGRVIRLETFSKTVAPGLRLGFLTAPEPIFKHFRYASQASTQGSAALSQMVMVQLFRKLGVDGFLQQCEKVNEFYAKRREMCLALAKRHLEDIAEWEAPTGGMFLWLKFKGVDDTLNLTMERLLKRKVLTVAGAAFQSNSGDKSPHVRIAYSMASEEAIEKGFKIIAEEVRALQNENKQ